MQGRTALAETIDLFGGHARYRSYPVLDPKRRLVGPVWRSGALEWRDGTRDLAASPEETLPDSGQQAVGLDMPCARVAELMSQSRVGRGPASSTGGRALGIVTRHDLPRARGQQLQEETVRSAPRLWPRSASRIEAP